jgi:signal transduction histidine kinase
MTETEQKLPLLSLIYEAGTTMNSILAFIRLLQFGGNGFNEEQKKYFENIAGGAAHFFEIVEFLTNIVKLQQDSLEINRANTNVQLFLQRLLADAPAFAFRRRIGYFSDIQPDIGEIEIDQNKMKKIIHDLVENMIMYTEQDHRVGIQAVRQNGEVQIQVWNDSAPLGKGFINQLFLPQIHNSYTTSSGETLDTVEIGFALARKIAELHRGSLSVENGTPKGTAVTITLPAGG